MRLYYLYLSNGLREEKWVELPYKGRKPKNKHRTFSKHIYVLKEDHEPPPQPFDAEASAHNLASG